MIPAQVPNYHSFGSTITERSASFGVEYRYGMNTQEKEPELGGGVFSAEFWMYDGKLGRRWNVDPVVKFFESPYCAFDDNPVFYSDEEGDDVTPVRFRNKNNQITGGLISVTFQFRFDPALNWSQQQQQDYINNHISTVQRTWGGMSLGTGSTSIFAGFINDGSSNYGTRNRRNEKLTNNVIVDVGITDSRVDLWGNSRNPENISWATRKGGYMWLNASNNGDDAAHEFGHILGLSDRYTEAAVWTPKLPVDRQSEIDRDRHTIPLKINRLREEGYNPSGNLMSNTLNGSLTQFQLSIAFSKSRKEKKYYRRLVLFRDIDFYRTHCADVNRFSKNIFGYTFNPTPPPSSPNYIQVTRGDYIVRSRSQVGYRILPGGNTWVEKRNSSDDINEDAVKDKLRTMRL